MREPQILILNTSVINSLEMPYVGKESNASRLRESYLLVQDEVLSSVKQSRWQSTNCTIVSENNDCIIRLRIYTLNSTNVNKSTFWEGQGNWRGEGQGACWWGENGRRKIVRQPLGRGRKQIWGNSPANRSSYMRGRASRKQQTYEISCNCWR